MTTGSTLSRSFPTFKHLTAPFRWVVGTRRRRWTAALALLAIIAAPVVWWSMQLLGLPDIGEPFDLEAFRSFKVPDERNAFVLYRRAAGLLRPSARSTQQSPGDELTPLTFWGSQLPAWSEASPYLRRLVEDNRAALAVYREAAERPDSGPVPSLDYFEILLALPRLHVLALLEASRLEDRSEMAEAWDWYRADLRTIRHEGKYGAFSERQITQLRLDRLRKRLTGWAADRRTNPAMLRRALDDVLACESISPSDSDSLRAEYFHDLAKWLDNPHDLASQMNGSKWNALFPIPDHYLSPDQMQTLYDLWRVWHREPERRRRIVRLAVANWLAYCDKPPAHRPAPDPDVTGPYEFFAFGPDAPANARALSPEALDRWLATSPEAKRLLDDWMGRRAFRINGNGIGKLRARERASYRTLVVLLASELYRRDHGADPPSDEALVGPYLERLPGDGTGEAGDQPGGREAGAVR
jgi:hypothetical protein